MAISRRDFIHVSLGSAALASLAACTNDSSGCKCCSACGCKDAKLNLSFQEGIAPGETLTEKLDFMEKLGVVGLEVGGSIRGGGLLGQRVDELKQALSGRNIKISVICAGFAGWLIAEDEAERQKCMETSKEIMAAGAELGALGMILVPGFSRQQPSLPMPQSRELLIEQLKELGEFGVQHNTTLILEPLNRREAWYLRLVADAAAMCRDTESDGVKCMGDFWHMTWEETCDMGAFISAGKKYLEHVHVASRKQRLMPGLDGEADNYVDGFKGLKMIGYDKYVSFECGLPRDGSVDRATAVTAAVELLREQWEQA
jgi:sugar phosphate isomerase/epimerase